MADIYNTFAHHVHQRMHKDGKPMPFGLIILGLVGELGELNDELEDNLSPNWDNVVSELGDTLWYLEAAVQSKQLAASFARLDRIADGKPLQHRLAKLCELGKKDAWHGKPAAPSAVAYHLGAVLHEIDRAIGFWARPSATLETAMKQNIEKLEKRYPMGIFVEGGGVRIEFEKARQDAEFIIAQQSIIPMDELMRAFKGDGIIK